MGLIEWIGAASRPRATVAPVAGGADLGVLGEPELLALVARGDHEALGEIYDRRIDLVWRVALHHAETRAAAEEAVYAVFLRLWREPLPGDATSLSARLFEDVAREARSKRAA